MFTQDEGERGVSMILDSKITARGSSIESDDQGMFALDSPDSSQPTPTTQQVDQQQLLLMIKQLKDGQEKLFEKLGMSKDNTIELNDDVKSNDSDDTISIEAEVVETNEKRDHQVSLWKRPNKSTRRNSNSIRP